MWFYSFLIRLAALWNPKARKWIEGRRGLFEQLKAGVGRQESGDGSQESRVKSRESGLQTPDSRLQTIDSRLVWMHCASLGEFEQGRPVLEAIHKQYPDNKILITFFSPSGYEIRKDYPGADYIFYLPLDSAKAVHKFLDIVQPSLVLWVKYEFWYYYLVALKKRNIPVLLVSGIFRPDQPFFKWYGRLHRYMLDCFQHLFVQTEDSKKLLHSISFTKNITVNGDTRFDRVITIAEQFEPIPLIEQFCGNSPVIVAGSTWPEDEEELDHFANTHPDIKFIIAPHEIDEDHLKEIEKLFKHTVRYSDLAAGSQESGVGSRESGAGSYRDGSNVIIIDNIGMLSRLYKYATITYVGGGFGNDGVHNVLEAAVFGKPVIFGPVYEKYIEAVELLEAGGAFSIETALELEQVLQNLLTDETLYQPAGEAARQYVYGRRGATDSVLQYIQENRLLTS